MTTRCVSRAGSRRPATSRWRTTSGSSRRSCARRSMVRPTSSRARPAMSSATRSPGSPELTGPLMPRADADPFRVLYIGGWGRSGSTLLDRLLGQAEGSFSVGEMRDLWLRGVLENRRCGCGEPFDSCPFWTRGRSRSVRWLGCRSREDHPSPQDALRPAVDAAHALRPPSVEPGARALRGRDCDGLPGRSEGVGRRRHHRLDEDPLVRIPPASYPRHRPALRPPGARQPRGRLFVAEVGRQTRRHVESTIG